MGCNLVISLVVLMSSGLFLVYFLVGDVGSDGLLNLNATAHYDDGCGDDGWTRLAGGWRRPCSRFCSLCYLSGGVGRPDTRVEALRELWWLGRWAAASTQHVAGSSFFLVEADKICRRARRFLAAG
jgi:hypothetical protein